MPKCQFVCCFDSNNSNCRQSLLRYITTPIFGTINHLYRLGYTERMSAALQIWRTCNLLQPSTYAIRTVTSGWHKEGWHIAFTWGSRKNCLCQFQRSKDSNSLLQQIWSEACFSY